MKKVGIITFLHNDNFGSALQAFALQAVIQDLGYECIHLNYQPDTKEKILNLLRSGNSPKLILDGLRKKSVKSCQAGARKKSAGFVSFYARRMKLSAPCASEKGLKKTAADYDILVCGSDQIWSPVWMNPVYFLSFASQGQRRIAYAPSLGIATLPAKRKIRKIRKWLKPFKVISVREEEGADILQQMIGEKPMVLPDPVCLLKKQAWLHLADEVHTDAPFILCYFIGESDAYWKKVAELHRETGYDVLVVPVTAASYYAGYPLLDGLSPEQFLGYLNASALVCTDSFHCTAFALILEKPFHVFRRYREDDPESKNSRIDSLFRRLAVDPERGVTDPGSVAERFESMRINGRKWLEKQLSE